MSGQKIIDGLNQAVGYAQGRAAGIEAAARVVENLWETLVEAESGFKEIPVSDKELGMLQFASGAVNDTLYRVRALAPERGGGSEGERYLFLECPDCQFSAVLTEARAHPYQCCPMCAEDNGRDIRMRERPATAEDKPEGSDDRPPAPPPPVPVQGESGGIGAWLSAALDDPAVCEAMKDDIRAWFDAGEPSRIRELEAEVARLTEDNRQRVQGTNYLLEKCDRLTTAAQAARDALEPFGDVFNEGNEDYPDSEPATIKCGRSTHYATKLGDYHRAAAALASLASVLDGGEG